MTEFGGPHPVTFGATAMLVGVREVMAVEDNDEGRNMGSPEEVAAAYEQFRAGMRPRGMTP